MNRFSFMIFSLCMAFLFVFAPASQAAELDSGARTILILPFQINASDEMANLNQELPALISQSLRDAGFEVLPMESAVSLLQRGNIKELNIATARRLAKQAGVDYALYGSYNQTGTSFSIDTRLVTANSDAPARPYFVQEDAVIKLLPAVNTLVERINVDAAHKGAVANIQIRGLKVLDEDVVLMRLQTRTGDVITPASLNNEIKRVWDLGYFSDVNASIEQSGEGTSLVFTVVEKPRINDVLINGSDELDKDEILVVMSTKTGSVLNERLLAQDIQKITDLYRKEGFYLADVKYRLETNSDKTMASLVFDVNEGNKLYIKEVKISGLSHLDQSDIEAYMKLSERSILSWFTGTGVLNEEDLERDSSAIAAYAMEQGHVDVKVGTPEITYEEDGIVIDFPVEEGPRYKLGTIGFKGDIIDTEEEMNKIIGLDEQKENNTYFSLTVLQEDAKALTNYYTDYGYAFAEINFDTPKDSETETIDVYYVAKKNERVRIRRLITDGNTHTRDNVILREMRLADGDMFEGSKLRRSNERLERLRYFKQVDTSLVPTGVPGEVDLKVSVVEDRTGALQAGVGYSTSYNMAFTASIQERNLFGRGYQLGLSGYTSGDGTAFNLNFVNPRVYDTDFGFGNNAYALWDEWDDFEKRTVGNTIRFFYPLGEYSSVGGGYRLDRYRLENVPDDAPRSYRDYEGDNLSSVVHANFNYDSTDSRTHPTRGQVAELFLEYGGGGLGGNDNFFRPSLEYGVFYAPFTNKDHVFHVRGRLAGVFKNTDKPVPVFDRYFIGGMDSIRGYDDTDLAPRDPGSDDEIGGDRIGYVNLEYIWLFEEDLGISIVPFFDIGFQIDSDQTSDPFSELKKSVGLELRWRSPMGDLRFAYGYPLDDNVFGENPGGRFDFTMGHFF